MSAGLVSDDRLARRATKGDERAFAAIYERYHQDLYRFCLAIVGNPADAQDALQNAMVKVLRALPGERRRIQLKPWLYRIAHNESVELLRKRRDTVEIEPELHAAGAELAETAATRERLRRLLADVGELPERQRATLVMRELAGLDFAAIGAAFETSDAVARQTVYEARLGLRQMEEGREMSCEHVMRELSGADGRVARRRDLRAHLRACSDCRAFRESIAERRHDFAAIAPLPLAASAGLLHAVLGGSNASAAAAGSGAGGSVAGTIAAGGGKAVATSAIVKSAATVAVVAVVGAGAADRGGVVDLGLPGGGAPAVQSGSPTEGRGGQTSSSTEQAAEGGGGNASAGEGVQPGATGNGASQGDRHAAGKAGAEGQGAANGQPEQGHGAGAPGAPNGASHGHGNSGNGSPPATSHGQQAAGAHGGGASASHHGAPSHHGSSGGHRSSRGHSHRSSHPAHSHPAQPPPPPPAAQGTVQSPPPAPSGEGGATAQRSPAPRPSAQTETTAQEP